MAKVSLQRITIIIMLSLLVMYPIVEKIFLNKYINSIVLTLKSRPPWSLGSWSLYQSLIYNFWFHSPTDATFQSWQRLPKWVFLGKDVNVQQRQTDTKISQIYWKLVLCMTKNIILLTMGFDVNAESWKKCLTCSLSAAAK